MKTTILLVVILGFVSCNFVVSQALSVDSPILMGTGTAGPSNANCTAGCVNGVCNSAAGVCICDDGWHGDDCSLRVPAKKPTSESWTPAIWIAVIMIVSVICLERLYSSCKRVYLRRQGRSGFSELPVFQNQPSGAQFDDEDDHVELDAGTDNRRNQNWGGRVEDDI